MQGASWDTIQAKRSEQPEVRKAAREQAVRCVRSLFPVAACCHALSCSAAKEQAKAKKAAKKQTKVYINEW